jgi:TonB family protein
MRLFLVSFFLLTSSVCFAQVKKVYFFKDDGREVFNNDSADYVRAVSEPDSGSRLFNVTEFYANGKKKLVGKSKSIEYNSFDGITMSFFKNGKRKAIITYVDGLPSGSSDEYYPNGKLYAHKELRPKEVAIPAQFRLNKIVIEKILESYDSLGTIKVKDGNGIYTLYNEGFSEITEQGPIVNGNKNGLWKGNDKKYNAVFEEEYKDGDLISGKALCDGLNTSYEVRFVPAGFKGGDSAFGRFLVHTVRYPAKEREKNIHGRVIISFVIDKTGVITDIKTLRSPSPGLSAEAIRVLELSPNWTPGMAYGIPAKVDYSMPFNFSLSTN